MNPDTIGPRPVPANAEPLYRAMGVLRSREWYISETTPPTMVANVLAPTPTKKRATSIPANESAKEQPINATMNNIPEPVKTGLRPLSSEKGARNMGDDAKPTAHVVTPLLNATVERPHFFSSVAEDMKYAPALYAAHSVAAQQRVRMIVLRVEDHRKGDSHWLRSGDGEIGCELSPGRLVGQSCGIGVSKVRHWYVIDCSCKSVSWNLEPVSSCKGEPASKP